MPHSVVCTGTSNNAGICRCEVATGAAGPGCWVVEDDALECESSPGKASAPSGIAPGAHSGRRYQMRVRSVSSF